MPDVIVVHLDSHVLAVQNKHLDAELEYLKFGGVGGGRGPASARWVSCKECGAYKGDECHTGRGYCASRIRANKLRLFELKTYAVRIQTPCHETNVVLVWRSTEDSLMWDGVPCFHPGCGVTYTVERSASDMLEDRFEVDRIHGHLVQMHCWASEENDPYNKAKEKAEA